MVHPSEDVSGNRVRRARDQRRRDGARRAGQCRKDARGDVGPRRLDQRGEPARPGTVRRCHETRLVERKSHRAEPSRSNQARR